MHTFAKWCEKLQISNLERCGSVQFFYTSMLKINEPSVTKTGFDIGENGPSRIWATNPPLGLKNIYEAFDEHFDMGADRAHKVPLSAPFRQFRDNSRLGFSQCQLSQCLNLLNVNVNILLFCVHPLEENSGSSGA